MIVAFYEFISYNYFIIYMKGCNVAKTKAKPKVEATNEPKNKGGRPTKYTKDVGDEICARLIADETLRSICQDEHMPARGNIFVWLASSNEIYKGFQDQYARAMEIRLDLMEHDLLDIADDSRLDTLTKEGKNGELYEVANGEWVGRARLMVDTRKWILSKRRAKKYGDKAGEEENKGNKPININIYKGDNPDVEVNNE